MTTPITEMADAQLQEFEDLTSVVLRRPDKLPLQPRYFLQDINKEYLRKFTKFDELPPHSYWSVGGVGDSQLKMNINGMVNGGGVRVGIEDNIWLTPKRENLATNNDLLQRVHTIAQALEIEIASPLEVREMLNIS